MKFSAAITICAGLLATASCNTFDPELGVAPFKCGLIEPRCPDDFSCVQTNPGVELCVADDQDPNNLPDGGAPPGEFVCNHDGELETNDTIQTATQTGIPESSMQRFVGLAICPAGDIDVFAIRVNPGSFATVTATLETGNGTGPLSVFLLNDQTGGQQVGEGMVDPTDATKVNLEVTSVPAGNYFIRVNGNGVGENNYNIDIAVTQ